MGKEKSGVGYEDWDKIVKVKEESLKVIAANKRNIEVGEIVENLILERARKERKKYPNPKEPKKEKPVGV